LDFSVTCILVVVAHPDDVDFGAAGTIAHWTDQGIQVAYCIVTDGDAGGHERAADAGGMAALRRAEQTVAAHLLGVHDVRFLGYPDGLVEPTLGLRQDIARIIRQVRPYRVLTHSPERNYARVAQSHPDHRAVGAATLDAIYPDARNPYAFPSLLADEGLEPWTVSEGWLRGGPTPNHYVDVTDTFDRKIAAIRAHASQTAHLENFDEVMRSRLAAIATTAGLPVGRLAESFQVVNTA
jgi:LmbE family N-acetylglucosaminyl deacetylase